MCSVNFDERIHALLAWLKVDLGLEVQAFETASSDASFRRYFRVRHADGCHIVMDAPPDKENIRPFIQNAGLLQTAGLHVPTIYQRNLEQGFLLLEDLGVQSFADVLNEDSVDQLYAQALDSLCLLQSRLPVDACPWPHYDQALLSRELGIFYEWFLEKRLGLVLPVAIRRHLDECLIESALSQLQVPVHRDYHSRNLMFLAGGQPGVIDFQDAVIGPVTYDVVSLLRDCYVRWPEQRVMHWLADYHQRLQQTVGLAADWAQFKIWFDLMGLQRHLKAIGIFSRLHLRDDKPGYLADIPRTLGYVVEVCQNYPQLAEFQGFLQHQVLPIYRAYL